MRRTAPTFRIFVSSTFTDLRAERNALAREVFPRLRELCARHGARFQAVDLRWGVRDEAALDQQTMRICLEEVERCRRISPRPNFLVLLGDRYGWRPLPHAIPDAEMRLLHAALDPTASRLFDEWYRRDDNARPPLHCLQARRDRFADRDVWETEVERPLMDALVHAAATVGLPVASRALLGASATEQEIRAGALRVEDAQDHVFCFFRSIAGMPTGSAAADWIDTLPDGRPDIGARAALATLKAALRDHLPGNCSDLVSRWTAGDPPFTTTHIGTLPADIEECIALLDRTADETLCAGVWRRLARIILEEATRHRGVDPLDREIAHHADFGRERARHFVGRASELARIADYIAAAAPQPLVLHGPSGAGKSALLAHAAIDAATRLDDAVITRFIGATSASSQTRPLLDGLCRQIARRYGNEERTPVDTRDLMREFEQRLALATAQRPLVLILDAIDQLPAADGGGDLSWLPARLPPHVRLIVSVLDEGPAHAPHAALVRRRFHDGDHLALDRLPAADGATLLEAWLTAAGRTLTGPQRNEVLRAFAATGMPLHLRLAFEEARQWASFRQPPPLGSDAEALIGDGLLRRLESPASHGPVLVGRALGYIAAARAGLSEDELLDVLSSDDAVIADFVQRARHEPPERRLPVAIWSRLLLDLEPYLAERHADGAVVLSFFHSEFSRVVEQRYLAGDDGARRHAALARYFDAQPLELGENAGNLRKLHELPWQLTRAAAWDELHALLTDLDFLEAKCTWSAVHSQRIAGQEIVVHGGVFELQDDLRAALDALP